MTSAAQFGVVSLFLGICNSMVLVDQEETAFFRCQLPQRKGGKDWERLARLLIPSLLSSICCAAISPNWDLAPERGRT